MLWVLPGCIFVTGKYQFSQCTNTQTLACVIFFCWPRFPGAYGLLVMLSWDYTRCGVYHTFNNFSLSFFSYCCKKMLWGEKATKEGRVYFSTEFKMQSFMTEKSRQWSMKKLTSLYLLTVSREHREMNACIPL